MSEFHISPKLESKIIKHIYTLSYDPFFKYFFKDVIVMALFLTSLFGIKITPDMIDYEDTENIAEGGLVIRHDLYVTVHFNDEDKVIHIGLEMQNQFDSALSLRMEDDLHLGKTIKLNSREDSKKISYYGIWFLSRQCAKHYEFNKFVKKYTYRDEDNDLLADNDYIYLIDLQKMSNCSTIELQELAQLFLRKDLKKSDFKTEAGKVWYTKMDELNHSDGLKINAYKAMLEERSRKAQIEDAKAEGETKGEANKAKEVAKKMLADGLDINVISKYIGLSIEEINKLK